MRKYCPQNHIVVANINCVARRIPELRVVVHDDACHLRLMAESKKSSTPIAQRLAHDMKYIVDEYHSTGHVGKWCSENCLPALPENKALLNGFPTNICVKFHKYTSLQLVSVFGGLAG